MEECSVGTVGDTKNAVLSLLFSGKSPSETICLNGTATCKTIAFPGATGATHEVCLNAIPDAPLSRPKSGNVRAPKGGLDVDSLNCVPAVTTYDASIR